MSRSGDVTDLYSFQRSSPLTQEDYQSQYEAKSQKSNPFLTFNFRQPPPSGTAPGSVFGKGDVKFDPAGQEAIPGERQWRVKASTEHSKKHSKIAAVTKSSIKLYDELGQEMQREYSLKEIYGFKTDIGIGVFAFTYRPTPSHPGEVVHLYSKKYCTDIQAAVNNSIAELLKQKNVKNPDQVLNDHGLNQVSETTPTQIMGKVVRRMSSAGKKDQQYPANGYVVPDSPTRRDSTSQASPSSKQVITAPRKSSAEKPKKKPERSGDFVDLDDDL